MSRERSALIRIAALFALRDRSTPMTKLEWDTWQIIRQVVKPTDHPSEEGEDGR